MSLDFKTENYTYVFIIMPSYDVLNPMPYIDSMYLMQSMINYKARQSKDLYTVVENMKALGLSEQEIEEKTGINEKKISKDASSIEMIKFRSRFNPGSSVHIVHSPMPLELENLQQTIDAHGRDGTLDEFMEQSKL